MQILEGTLVLIRPLPETVIFSKNAWCCGFFDLMKHTQQGENLLSLMQGRWYFEILTFTKMYTCTVLYTTLKNLNMSENWLGMQISNFRYANMDFFKTPHIQIRFLWKDPVFKYELLWLFIYPCLPVPASIQVKVCNTTVPLLPPVSCWTHKNFFLWCLSQIPNSTLCRSVFALEY